MAYNDRFEPLSSVITAIRGTIPRYGTGAQPLRLFVGMVTDSGFPGFEQLGWTAVGTNGDYTYSPPDQTHRLNAGSGPSRSMPQAGDPIWATFLATALEGTGLLGSATPIELVANVSAPHDAEIWLGIRDFSGDTGWTSVPAATATLPGDITGRSASLVFINSTSANFAVPSSSPSASWNPRYIFSTVVHEIGHALGLFHPEETNAGRGTVRVESDYTRAIMSNVPTVIDSNFIPLAPMLFDVAVSFPRNFVFHEVGYILD